MNYSEQLKDPRWQKKRLEIMQRDSFKCASCGDEKSTLHVHHKNYVNGKAPWEYGDSLITLCEKCHSKTHLIEKIVLEDGGILSPVDFLQSDPDYIELIKSIENHKGLWVLDFNEHATLFGILWVFYRLNKFVDGCDCQFFQKGHEYFNLYDIVCNLTDQVMEEKRP